MNSKIIVRLGLFCWLLAAGIAMAGGECGEIPTDGCVVSRDTVFSTGNYFLPRGISLRSGVSLDCNHSILNGGHSLANGVSIINERDVSLKNCLVKNYERANLFVWRAGNVDTADSAFSGSLSNYGVELKDATAVRLRNNALDGNRVGLQVEGAAPAHYQHDIDESNSVNGQKIIYLTGDNIRIEDEEAGHLEVAQGRNIYVARNRVAGDGLKFRETSGLTVADNTVSGAAVGLDILSADDVSVSGNVLTDNKFGARLFRISDFVFSGNQISNNAFYGLIIASAEGGEISGNTVSASGWDGLNLSYATSNSFLNNVIESSGKNSITVSGVEKSLGNVFKFNRIYKNAEYALENKQKGKIVAKDNWWGSALREEIEKLIFDETDDRRRSGPVVFEPFWCSYEGERC